MPVSTFLPRVIIKWKFIWSNLFTILGNLFLVSGARSVGLTDENNVLLKLNRDYPLGDKGQIIALPRDEVIFNQVKKKGSWEFVESNFLADGLTLAQKSGITNVALLDIGANAGLITLQAMNIAKLTCTAHLFEPLSDHCAAIQYNLSRFKPKSKIVVHNFALGAVTGTTEIYTQISNRGNSSLFGSLVPSREKKTSSIDMIKTSDFFSAFDGYDRYLIKCDTQGMDASILTQIPDSIWKFTERLIVEVWAIQEINKSDVENLLELWSDFDYIDWSPSSTHRIPVNDLKTFWLSGSGESRNLYLSKNLVRDFR